MSIRTYIHTDVIEFDKVFMSRFPGSWRAELELLVLSLCILPCLRHQSTEVCIQRNYQDNFSKRRNIPGFEHPLTIIFL